MNGGVIAGCRWRTPGLFGSSIPTENFVVWDH